MDEDHFVNEIDTLDAELLVRLSVITKGELLERRRGIHKSLVMAALTKFSPSASFNLDELSKQIHHICKCSLEDTNIVTILEDLENENIVEHDTEFRYKLISKPDIPNFEELSNPVWASFNKFLIDHYPQYDSFIHSEIKDVFNSILLKSLIRFSISKPLSTQTESLPFADIESIIKNELERCYFDDLTQRKLPELILEFFSTSNKELLDFIFTCYSGMIDIDLVTREQEMPIINFGDEVESLLIDTNFIVSLMCRSDPLHPLSSTLVNHCNKSQIPLYYSSLTKNEFIGLISASKSEMRGLTNKSSSPADNQFISDRLKLNIPWSSYIVYLENWGQILESKYAITPLDEYFEKNLDGQIIETARMAINVIDQIKFEERSKKDKNYVLRRRGEDKIAHDSTCISIVGSLKQTIQSNKLGPWFLTYDNLLLAVNSMRFQDQDEFGYAIHPRTLLNYFLAYSTIDFTDEDKEEVALALLRYSTRKKQIHLTVDEYSELVSEKLGLDLTNAEVLKQIFMQSPLLEELKKSLEYESSEGPDSVAYQMLTDPSINDLVERIIESNLGIEERDENIKRLRDSIKRLNDENQKLRGFKEGSISSSGTINITLENNSTTNIILDPAVPPAITSLISFLDQENAFKDEIIEKPSKNLDLDSAKKWIDTVKSTIETSSKITGGIRALLPYVVHLQQLLS
ncbi:putative nucleic acid-binding protein [Methanohalophilus levihalophilus]|uniref:hypothetical protein n=1 Tax=Methanohalophilus levihalophilus TaxID=1431282 RepID=UPI001AE1591F|nr:hypothetical protein [Methanohalophilus levihalophilus]MBP2030535.1 putative nucleic acid-binding protein [Methanohalophilus levihalophilus]